ILGYRRALVCRPGAGGAFVPAVDVGGEQPAGAATFAAALLNEDHKIGASYFIRFNDPLWRQHPPLRPADPGDGDASRWHPGDLLLTPVTAADGAVLGLIAVDEPADGGLPDADALQHLELLAHQAALVIDPRSAAALSAGARRLAQVEKLFARLAVAGAAAARQDGLLLLDTERAVLLANDVARKYMAGSELSPAALRLEPPDSDWLRQALLKLEKGKSATAHRLVTIDEALIDVRLQRIDDDGKPAGYLVALSQAFDEICSRFRAVREDIAASTDGESVGEFLLAMLKRTLDFDSAVLLAREKGGQYKLLANAGLLEKVDRSHDVIVKKGLAEAALAEGRPLTLSGGPGQLAGSSGIEGADEARLTSMVAVPLAEHRQPTGLLVLARGSGAAYGPAHCALLTEVAAIMVGIIGHSRVAEKVRNESLLRNKLYEIGFSAGSVLQIGSVLSLMIRTIAKELRVEEIGIYFYDDVLSEWNGKSIMMQPISPGFLQLVREGRIKLDPQKLSEIRDITAEVIARGEPEIIPDLAGDHRFTQPFPNAGLRSGLWLPLKVKDKTIGALAALSKQPAYFGKDDLALLEEVAPLVTFALRSAMFYEEIRREGSRLAAIINSMPEGLLMIDAQFRVTMGNEAFEKLWSLKRQVRTGADLREEIVPQLTERLIDATQLLGFFRECASSPDGAVPPVELELVDHRYLRISAFPVEEPERPRSGSVIIAQDVTNEKQVAKLREEFVGMLSHDLRNPLSAIIATLELALDGSLGELNENQQQFLTNAMNDSRRMLEMLNDLLDGYKYDAVELKLEKTGFDLAQVVANLIAEFSPLAREREIELLQQMPIKLPVTADEGKINRVVSNLLSNALKFTPKQGRILIAAVEKPTLIEVSVTDNGEGIPPEDRERVFEKFYQVKKRKLGRKTGTGLGLPLCRQLVEAHGGKIWVESQYGKGSTFIFTLPK
ncbi:MAG TPA: ATP-binding protein, partial [Candidatus Edwardsbacteria bacterium]|nr:ATP-binding protein [Candidatus Edwardsbacteria bacterium]